MRADTAGVTNVNHLASAASTRFRVAALALPVYTRFSRQTFEAYGFGAVRMTLVVSPDSRLLQRWRGAYAGMAQEEIEDFVDAVAGVDVRGRVPVPDGAGHGDHSRAVL